MKIKAGYSWCVVLGVMTFGPSSAVQADELEALFSDAGQPAASSDSGQASTEDDGGNDAGDHDTARDNAEVITLADTPPAPPPRNKSRRVIEEIVVTAQKSEQSLRDVPMSVSAIDGEFVRDAAITDAQELVQYTPNVKFTQAFSAVPTITIRGFGSPPLARSIEPSVGLVIDDVFFGRSTFTNDGVFDLKRLEVLRGPQGTLFGKNTVAGVMNFVTAEPSFEPAGYAMVSAGTLDHRRAEGGFSFPLIDDVLAARISFRARGRESGQVNSAQAFEQERSDDLSGRLKLSWLISENLELDISAFSTRQVSEGIGFGYEVVQEGTLAVFREFDPNAEGDIFNGLLSSDGDTFFERNSTSLSGKLTRHIETLGPFDNLALNLILNSAQIESPFRLDQDFSAIPWSNVQTLGPELYKQGSAELRMTGKTGGLLGWGQSMDWIAGAFFFDTSFDATQQALLNASYLDDWLRAGAITGRPLPALPTPCSNLPSDLHPACGARQADQVEEVLNILQSKGRSLALFAQTTWYLTERLSSVIGVRIGREEKSAFQSSQSTNNVISSLAGQEDFERSGTREESEFSPKLALAYDWNDAVTLFANAARGFKSGGFSGPLVAPSNSEYEAEKAVSFELGAKTRLLEGSLVLNATAFALRFDQLQLPAFDGVNISTINAEAAEAFGFELDFQWLPRLQFLTLHGSAGFTDSRYKDFPCGPAKVSDSNQNNPPECPPPQSPRSPAFQDLSGRTLPFAPRFSASFSPSIKLPLFRNQGIGMLVGLDVLYQGEHFLDVDLDDETFQKATTKLNLRVGLSPINGPWALILQGKNLTGAKERLMMLDTPQLPGAFVAIPKYDKPTFALDLRYSFGP